MEITVNGERHRFDGEMTVEQLLTHLKLTERRVAVEVNLEIVPRSQHDSHILRSDDAVEIVHAIGGG